MSLTTNVEVTQEIIGTGNYLPYAAARTSTSLQVEFDLSSTALVNISGHSLSGAELLKFNGVSWVNGGFQGGTSAPWNVNLTLAPGLYKFGISAASNLNTRTYHTLAENTITAQAVAAVPEPSSFVALGLGVFALGRSLRRKLK